MDAFQLGELCVIGVVTGVVGGMLGIGGSLVMIPALTEILGPDQHLYQASAMIVNFFVVVPAVVRHRRARAIDPSTVRRLIPLAALAVVGGVLLSELSLFAGSGEAYLRLLFGLFLVSVCVLDLFRAYKRRTNKGRRACDPSDTKGPTVTAWQTAIVAIPTGLIAGLLGVGGGVMAVPLQHRYLRIPLRNAIANSATIIIATSLIGATLKNYAYVVDHAGSLRSLALACVLIPTAMTGSWFGSKLTHELPLRWVKAGFFALLAIAGVRISVRAVADLRVPSPHRTTATTPQSKVK